MGVSYGWIISRIHPYYQMRGSNSTTISRFRIFFNKGGTQLDERFNFNYNFMILLYFNFLIYSTTSWWSIQLQYDVRLMIQLELKNLFTMINWTIQIFHPNIDTSMYWSIHVFIIHLYQYLLIHPCIDPFHVSIQCTYIDI